MRALGEGRGSISEAAKTLKCSPQTMNDLIGAARRLFDVRENPQMFSADDLRRGGTRVFVVRMQHLEFRRTKPKTVMISVPPRGTLPLPATLPRGERPSCIPFFGNAKAA